MSYRVARAVWDHGPSERDELLVLLALAEYADDDGCCFPSMAGIAEKARMTDRGARGIIRRLEAKGFLEVKVGGGRGGKSHYRITVNTEARSEIREENPEPQTRNEPAQTRNGVPSKVVNPERHDTKPGTSVPPNRQEPSEVREGAIAPMAAEAKPPPKFRIPPDWRPSEVGIAFAREHLPDEVSREELQGFRIYWTDRGDRKSAAGWEQTWRNRVRDVAARLSRRPPTPPNGSRSKSNERVSAWLDAAHDACGPDLAGWSDRDPPQALLRG